MARFDSLATLRSFDGERLRRLANHLSVAGFVTDEDQFELGAMVVEHWTSSCTQFLQGYGFDGDALENIGDFFPERGAIYALYNPSKLSYERARAALKAAGRA